MRLTNCLLKQHNGWIQRLKWKQFGHRRVLETGVQFDLEKRGFSVKDSSEYLKRTLYYTPKVVENVKRVYQVSASNLSFGNSNVLVYGLAQGQALTNTVTFEGFPEAIESRIQSVKIPTAIERSMHQAVLISHLLDAQQVKSYVRKSVFAHKNLFKHKFPREWGISDERKNYLLASRLLNHCERFHGTGAKHRISENLNFVLPIYIDNKNVEFRIKAEILVSSLRPINPLDTSNLAKSSFLKIDPLAPTISIPNVKTEIAPHSKYPIVPSTLHPHLIMLDYSKFRVRNLHEEPVTDTQFESRALVKAFTVASAWARKMYGENASKIQEPVVIQTVHLDKERIQFGIFQLNSLDLQGENKNYWFRKPIINLYDECKYVDGRPHLSNYNFDIFKTMCVLYGNN